MRNVIYNSVTAFALVCVIFSSQVAIAQEESTGNALRDSGNALSFVSEIANKSGAKFIGRALGPLAIGLTGASAVQNVLKGDLAAAVGDITSGVVGLVTVPVGAAIGTAIGGPGPGTVVGAGGGVAVAGMAGKLAESAVRLAVRRAGRADRPVHAVRRAVRRIQNSFADNRTDFQKRMDDVGLKPADYANEIGLRSSPRPGELARFQARLRRQLIQLEADAASRAGRSYIRNEDTLDEIRYYESLASQEELNAKLRWDRRQLRLDRHRFLAKLDAKRRQERQRILHPLWEDLRRFEKRWPRYRKWYFYGYRYSYRYRWYWAEWRRIHKRIREAAKKLEKRFRKAEKKAEERFRKAEERFRKAEKKERLKAVKRIRQAEERFFRKSEKRIRKAHKRIREPNMVRINLENNYALGTAVLVDYDGDYRGYHSYTFEGDAGRAAGSALIGGSGGNLTLRFPRLKESVPNSDTLIPSDRIKVRARDYGDYSYVAWGSWSGGENTRFNTRSYRGVDRNVRGGHWIYGQRLGAADIPRSGVARYVGQAMGFLSDRSVSPHTLEMNSITGDINMAVTFRDSNFRLSGSLNLDRNGTAWATARFNNQNAKSSSPNHHFSANLKVDVVGDDGESSLSGSFFGANAAEVGGDFNVHKFVRSGDRRGIQRAVGVFRAKKQ